jgi:hypothetical protein
MEMKTFDAVINLSPWSAAIGASGMLNKAWVRIRNIPAEKRCDANVAYAGSLVGVTLEVDQATLHKPEFCRILLGCRDIDKLAETAEGVLGDFFYTFAYEVESVVVQGPPVVKNMVTVANSSTPSSPKRARTETYSVAASDASTGGFTGATSQSGGAGYGKSCAMALATVSEHESEEEEESDIGDNDSELFIDTIARENRINIGDVAAELVAPDGDMVEQPIVEKEMSHTPSSQLVIAPITPVVEKEVVSPDVIKSDSRMATSYADAVKGCTWSSSPVVTEVENEELIEGSGRAEYYVQSPSTAVIDVVSPVEKLVLPEVETRVSSRNLEGKMGSIMEQAAALTKKRNLEGNSIPPPSSNSFGVLSNNEIMVRSSLMVIDMPSNNFERIDVLKELEVARNNMAQKNEKLHDSSFVLHHDHSKQTPLCLTWLDDEEIDESFTVVSSRKSRKNSSKKVVKISKPMTRSQSKGDSAAQAPGRSVRPRRKTDRFK